MFISKNYPQNLNESVTIARHYGNGTLEFQFKQDAQQLMHRHFQQCAQLIYLHQISSLQTVDNRLLLFCIFYKQRLLHRLRTAFPTHHVNDIRRRCRKRSHIFAYQCVASFGIHIAHPSRKSEHIPAVVLRHFGSHQRAALKRRLHHHSAVAERGYYAVSRQEIRPMHARTAGGGAQCRQPQSDAAPDISYPARAPSQPP